MRQAFQVSGQQFKHLIAFIFRVDSNFHARNKTNCNIVVQDRAQMVYNVTYDCLLETGHALKFRWSSTSLRNVTQIAQPRPSSPSPRKISEKA